MKYIIEAHTKITLQVKMAFMNASEEELESGELRFDGFTFFGSQEFDVHEMNARYLVAIDDHQNQIIGIMKFRRYSLLTAQPIDESDKLIFDNYIKIEYVDVVSEWRTQGVATNLYFHLNQLLDKTDTIVGRPLTEDGRNAQLDEIREEHILNCQSYSTFEEYEDIYYNHE